MRGKCKQKILKSHEADDKLIKMDDYFRKLSDHPLFDIVHARKMFNQINPQKLSSQNVVGYKYYEEYLTLRELGYDHTTALKNSNSYNSMSDDAFKTTIGRKLKDKVKSGGGAGADSSTTMSFTVNDDATMVHIGDNTIQVHGGVEELQTLIAQLLANKSK